MRADKELRRCGKTLTKGAGHALAVAGEERKQGVWLELEGMGSVT